MQNMNNGSVQLLNSLYQVNRMSVSTIDSVLKRTEDEGLRQELCNQKQMYGRFSREAETMLNNAGQCPKEPSLMGKLGAEWGITTKTMFDRDADKIAEMMIQGTTMGITELTRERSDCESCGSPDLEATKKARDLCDTVISYEQESIERLKGYLN